MRERQMRLYGHVARFPADDPPAPILSARKPVGRTHPVEIHMTRGCVRWIVILLGVGDGPCGGMEDGHQETEGVPLEGRCGNALPRRMLPLTD